LPPLCQPLEWPPLAIFGSLNFGWLNFGWLYRGALYFGSLNFGWLNRASFPPL
jgi:hypothetical protein